MTDFTNKREHYNLYYILKEDKENHIISQESIDKIWASIIENINSQGTPP